MEATQIANEIKVGDKVRVISRSSKTYGEFVGTVVKPGMDGSFGPSWVVEHKALFADFGPTWTQMDSTTFRAADLEVA